MEENLKKKKINTMRYCLIPVRWLSSKIPQITNVGKDVEKCTLVHCWWKYKLVQPLWKTIWRCLKKLKTELPCDSAIPLLCIYPKKMKTLIWKDTHTPMFIAALFTIVKMGKQPKYPSTDKWIKKIWYVYIYIYTIQGILLSHNKEWNFAICNNTAGAGGYYA